MPPTTRITEAIIMDHFTPCFSRNGPNLSPYLLVINAIKRLQDRKQKHLDKGADDALFLAMMDDEDAV